MQNIWSIKLKEIYLEVLKISNDKFDKIETEKLNKGSKNNKTK